MLRSQHYLRWLQLLRCAPVFPCRWRAQSRGGETAFSKHPLARQARLKKPQTIVKLGQSQRPARAAGDDCRWLASKHDLLRDPEHGTFVPRPRNRTQCNPGVRTRGRVLGQLTPAAAKLVLAVRSTAEWRRYRRLAGQYQGPRQCPSPVKRWVRWTALTIPLRMSFCLRRPVDAHVDVGWTLIVSTRQ